MAREVTCAHSLGWGGEMQSQAQGMLLAQPRARVQELHPPGTGLTVGMEGSIPARIL